MTATFCNAPTSPNIGGFGSKPRVHIERRVGNELRVRDERRSRKQHFVQSHPAEAFRRLTNCATEQTTSKKKLRGNSGSSPERGIVGPGGKAAPSIPLEYEAVVSTELILADVASIKRHFAPCERLRPAVHSIGRWRGRNRQTRDGDRRSDRSSQSSRTGRAALWRSFGFRSRH